MAKEEKNLEAGPPSEETQAPPKKRGASVTTLGVFGGIMIAEGLAIFLGMKFLGSDPDPTEGMVNAAATTRPVDESQELVAAELRIPNSNGARTTLYSVKVVLEVHYTNREAVEEFLGKKKYTIEDAISRVVRSADEKHLSEPGLETLKRQVRFELGTILGDEALIEQVLIPECMPMPTGF